MMRNWQQLSQSTVASVCIRYTYIDSVILLDTILLFSLPYMQSKLYKKMIESQGRSDIATELMIYHMHVCILLIRGGGSTGMSHP